MIETKLGEFAVARVPAQLHPHGCLLGPKLVDASLVGVREHVGLGHRLARVIRAIDTRVHQLERMNRSEAEV